mmetsp:Transcript_9868/g.14729  ORF Transcript_9868/g.14729 Transcript_9868/m.14729 type:complete len:445 (+) Transcript_9868:1-1335(+)
MCFKMAFFLVSIWVASGLKVGFYEAEPYVGEKSIAKNVLERALTDLGENPQYLYFSNSEEALQCVQETNCDLAFTDVDTKLVLSYPVFYDRGIIVTKDSRNVGNLLWQLFVIMLAVWVPFVLLLGLVQCFLNFKKRSLILRYFSGVYSVFNLSHTEKPLGKILGLMSILALFILVCVTVADLASVLGSANSYGSLTTLEAESYDLCSTAYWGSVFSSQKVANLEECLEGLESQDFEAVAAGRLELGYLDSDKWDNLVIHDTFANEKLFYFGFKSNSDTKSQIDDALQTLWKSRVINQVSQEFYTTIPFKHYSQHSLILENPVVLLSGISLLVLIVVCLAVTWICNYLKPRKSPMQGQITELSPGGFLSTREHNRTLSLEKSKFMFQQGNGRPQDEWVNKAVPIEDENAHKIRNIHDYENELSAVPNQDSPDSYSMPFASLFVSS